MIKLTDTDQFPVQVRAISDGDPTNASYTNAAPQDLADRTRFLKTTIDQAGLTREGATRIRFVEDPAEMAATLDVKRGDVCVASNAGAYVYWGPLGGSPAPAPWAYESTTHPGSYWVHSTFGITDRAGAPGGIVTLDHEGRIPAAMPKNGVVELKSVAANLVQYDYSFEEWGEVELPLELSLQAGDVVHLDAGASVRLIGGATWAQMGIAHKTSPLTPIVGSTADVAVGTRHRVATCARFVASATEVHAFVIGVRLRDVGAGKGIGVIGDAILRATVYRP